MRDIDQTQGIIYNMTNESLIIRPLWSTIYSYKPYFLLGVYNSFKAQDLKTLVHQDFIFFISRTNYILELMQKLMVYRQESLNNNISQVNLKRRPISYLTLKFPLHLSQ